MKKLILISALLFSFNGWADIQDDETHQTVTDLMLTVALNSNPRSVSAIFGHDITVIACDISTERTNNFDEKVIPSDDMSFLFAYTERTLHMKAPMIGQRWLFLSQIKSEGAERSDIFDDHLNSHHRTPIMKVSFDEDAILINVNNKDRKKPFSPDENIRLINEKSEIQVNRNTGKFYYQQTEELELNPDIFPPDFISSMKNPEFYTTGRGSCNLANEKMF